MVFKRHFFRIISVLTVCIAVLLTCTFPAGAASVKLSRTSATIVKGSGFTLSVKGSDEKVQWSSSNPKVASVSSGGKVRGISTGSTVIKAAIGDTVLKCKVRVISGKIASDVDVLDVPNGGSGTATITVKGSKKITAVIGNRNVASVSWGTWNGSSIPVTVKGKGIGSTEIKIVSAIDKSVFCTFTVVVYDSNDAVEITDDDSIDEDIDETEGLSREEQILYYVNQARIEAGVGELVLDEELCVIADTRAKEISEYFSHTRPNGNPWNSAFTDKGYNCTAAAENIAAGCESAKDTVERWLKSEGHRRNILDESYTKLGVGYCRDDDTHYTYFWTQEFSN